MGVVYRDNDKPAVITKNTSIGKNGLPNGGVFGAKRLIFNAQIWFKHGLIHRDDDKPAAISDERKMWYCNDELHRDNNKPAIICNDGTRHLR